VCKKFGHPFRTGEAPPAGDGLLRAAAVCLIICARSQYLKRGPNFLHTTRTVTGVSAGYGARTVSRLSDIQTVQIARRNTAKFQIKTSYVLGYWIEGGLMVRKWAND
jgi:hypothetical protein